MTACDTTHLLLQAELDGELGAADAIGLERHLETCPDCTALRTELAALSTRLRGGLTRHVAPPTLRRPAARRRPALGHAASFGAGLAVAASLMLVMLRPAPNADDGTGFLAAHVRALQPGHLLDVPSTDRHTVKPWFDGRLPFSPNVPDLAADGFPLIGGRLDYLGPDHFGGHPVAVLVYTRRDHVIDVFVGPGTRPERAAALQGYNNVGWIDDGLVYQAVSDLNPAELATFVSLMQR